MTTKTPKSNHDTIKKQENDFQRVVNATGFPHTPKLNPSTGGNTNVNHR